MSGKRTRIFIVEDESIILMGLSLVLEDSGYTVEWAADGRKALERIAAAPPDLIITDYMMPVMDGAELIETLRADARLCAIPLVVSTAVDEDILRRRTTAYDAFLPKPAKERDVLRTVERLLDASGD